MGDFLAKEINPPEVVLSSTASRAFYTALHICDSFKVSEDIISLSKGLFHAGPREILDIVRRAPECNTIAIFGHNPGFTHTANQLANLHIENIPTCGVVGISFNLDQWSALDFGTGRKEFFYYPKGI